MEMPGLKRQPGQIRILSYKNFMYISTGILSICSEPGVYDHTHRVEYNQEIDG